MAKRIKKIAPVTVETIESFANLTADVGDFDTPTLSDAELDFLAEMDQALPAAQIEAAADLGFTPPPAEPTPEDLAAYEEMQAVLASIDPAMESAVTAGGVDHVSQVSSWTPETEAAEIQLDAVLAELDKAEKIPEAALAASAETFNAPLTLAQLLATVPDDLVNHAVVSIANAVDERSAFEIESDPDNLNIHRTLKKVRAQLVTKRAARLLSAIHVEPEFLNRTVHNGSRYNVYALGKLADIVYGVTDGVVANAINVACCKSLFAFKRAGITFTMECAKASASKSYARGIDAAIRKHLISHTVAPSTAPTQASSTMQALHTLGVVRSNGAGKNPTYTVLDTPLSRKIKEMLMVA